MINVVGKSKLWFLISGALIFISVLAMIYTKINYGHFLRFGIDFTGGTMMEVNFDQNISKNDLEQELNSSFHEFSPIIQSLGGNNFIIKTKELNDEMHAKVIDNLKQKFGKFSEPQFTTVGPTIGETMKTNAFIAVIVASIMIVIYIAFAFRNLPDELSSWNFGIAAIIALIHDVLITVGVFAVMGIVQGFEIDTLFITALLTVMGFSVHDTIVVFDRIRENIHKKSSGDTLADIGNKAVNQTMRRSINTSMSVILPLIVLFILGSNSTSMFTLVLIIGITLGTCSSIFLATPFLILISPKEELSDIKK